MRVVLRHRVERYAADITGVAALETCIEEKEQDKQKQTVRYTTDTQHNTNKQSKTMQTYQSKVA